MTELYSTLFDQYQRYRTAARVIEAVASGERLRILEVGANVHRNLERFAPGHDILYLDRELPEPVADDPAFVRGDATAMTFPDGHFDLAIALDVFEHITPDERPAFLREMARVSTRGVLIGAPFDTPGVHAAEVSANSFYRRLSGLEHPWLSEHIENGLPDLGATQSALASMGLAVSVFAHGELRLWLAMTQAHLCESVFPDLARKAQALYRIYARDVYPFDTAAPTYRQYVFAARAAPWIEAFRTLEYGGAVPALTEDLRHVADGMALLTINVVERQRSLERQAEAGNDVPGRAARLSRRIRAAFVRPLQRARSSGALAVHAGAILRRAASRSGWRGALSPVLRAWREQGTLGVRLLFAERGEPIRYRSWARARDRADVLSRNACEALARRLRGAPRFAFMVDARGADDRWLDTSLQGLLGLYYADWTALVLSDRDPLMRHGDRRLKSVRSWGEALEAMQAQGGEYVIVLSPGVELRAHALTAMAVFIDAHPDVVAVYADEDRIDAYRDRYDPWFKPDWDAELLLGQDYLGAFACIRADRVPAALDIGRLPGPLLGWAVKLYATAGLRRRHVGHLAQMLSHVHDGSPATHVPDEASARAMLRHHLAQTGSNAAVERAPRGGLRVRYPLPTPAPPVSIVVPTRNAHALVRQCIESIRGLSTYPHFEILLVDNQSNEPESLRYFEHLAESGQASVLRYAAPFNFSAINNFAVAQASGEVVCLLNNDTQVITPGWLEEMVSLAVRPGIGAVGPMLYFPDDTIQHAGVVLGLGGIAGHRFLRCHRGYTGPRERLTHVQSVAAVTGACLVIRKAIYEQVGGLDEVDFEVAYNDIDFCIRVQERGYRNLWTPFAELYHYETATRGSDLAPERRARWERECAAMRRRWGDVLDRDGADAYLLM
jgi:GT2 family glycosyltransferase